ncbi:UNVERIFIED_CONTAM: hypothetical protein NCL1_10867 [Trichonephila clavipes]
MVSHLLERAEDSYRAVTIPTEWDVPVKMVRLWDRLPLELRTAHGCTECLPTRPAAPDTGNVGTELLPSNNAPSPFFTTMFSTLVIGPTMFPIAKSTNFTMTDFIHQRDIILLAICKDQPNGHIPIEKSCGRFWLCVGGYPRLQRCPAGLAFSPTALRCELSQNVPGWKRKSSKHLTGKWVIGNAIREPPPTTPAAEDEDDSKAGNQVQADAPPRRANNARPAGQFRPQNGK